MQLKPVVLILTLLPFLAPAQPDGYYDNAAGLSGAQLKTALHKIIRGHTRETYDYLWTAFYTTDDKPNGTVWDIYSDIPDGSANGIPPYVYNFGPPDQCANTPGYENGCYNREHTFPKSWWGGGDLAADTMYTDLFHLYPTDSKVNTMRNNNPYGEVAVANWTSLNGSKLGPCTRSGYAGTAFEPLDGYKGDVARNYFYMATRYENRIASWETLTTEGDVILDGTPYPCFEPWFLQMLLDWNALDPVSTKETARNNEIYTAYQNNRNPFIDHPEYINAIWGGSSVLPEPSNFPADFSAHNIHLQWTDATGTIVPDGYLIRMSTVSFTSISNPVDGTPYADDANTLNTASGIEGAWFRNLNPGTTYYFRLFGYTGSSSGIDYKTDGEVPQVMMTTGL